MGCMESKENVQIPWELSSLSRHEWLEWKHCFLSFMSHKYIPPYKQIDKFFKYIGYLGEEIAKQLYLPDSKSEMKLKVLLFKFDVYFIFGGIAKHNNQTVNDYILLLKNVAEGSGNNSNIENIVKEKILQDFKSRNVFKKLEKLSISSQISDHENLALHELIFLWNGCEVEVRTHCQYCGICHGPIKCYAKDHTCWNCGELNHFARCCTTLKTYTTNCPNCGTNHTKNNCPAFSKQCSKCKGMNHFSWKCLTQIVQSCIYCGRSHIRSRQHCPASSNRCSNCSRVGHFTSHCLSNRNRAYKI